MICHFLADQMRRPPESGHRRPSDWSPGRHGESGGVRAAALSISAPADYGATLLVWRVRLRGPLKRGYVRQATVRCGFRARDPCSLRPNRFGNALAGTGPRHARFLSQLGRLRGDPLTAVTGNVAVAVATTSALSPSQSVPTSTPSRHSGSLSFPAGKLHHAR